MVLGNLAQGDSTLFVYGAVTLYGSCFPQDSTKWEFCNSPKSPQPLPARPHYPQCATAAALARTEFRLFPFRSPLLGESHSVSFPPGTEMFHFPGSRPLPKAFGRVIPYYRDQVSPFGHPRITACLRLPEAYRSLPRPSSPAGAEPSTVSP